MTLSMMQRRFGGISLVAPLVAALMLLVVAPLVAAGAPMSDRAKALAKLDDDWSKAAATRDAAQVASFYADDAMTYPPNEPVTMGKAAAQKVWASYFAEPTFKISWRTTHAEVTGNFGYTSGTYEDSFKRPDGKMIQETGKYLCVLEEAGERLVESRTRHVEFGFEVETNSS